MTLDPTIGLQAVWEPPRLEIDGGAYTFRFHNQRLRATVDRLDPMRNVLRADLLIQGFDDAHFVYDGNCELTSELTRKRLADAVRERYPGYPWQQIIDSIAVRTLRAYREGNPWICLADMEAPPDTVQYLVKPILEAGTSTLLFADGGSGKSYLATAFALMVATGEAMGGMIATIPPSNVVYLDWESNEESYWRRVNALTSTMGLPIPDTMFYRQMTGRLSGVTVEVKAYCKSNQIALVIVDSAALAAGESETSVDATRLFDALRQVGVTALVVAHTTKTDPNRPFGSVFMRNGPRSVWKLVRDDDHSDTLTLAAQHIKANNSMLQPPLGWQLTFEDQGRIVTFRASEAQLLNEVTSTQPLRIQIRNLLLEGALWSTEIAEHLSLTTKQGRDSIAAALRRGEGKDFVRLHYQGRSIQWGVLHE